jgi:hypothetical protein
MTPKEKATELVEKFYSKTDALGLVLCVYWSNAKQCALIAVDEILNAGKDVDEFADAFWQEVKQEIINL